MLAKLTRREPKARQRSASDSSRAGRPLETRGVARQCAFCCQSTTISASCGAVREQLNARSRGRNQRVGAVIRIVAEDRRERVLLVRLLRRGAKLTRAELAQRATHRRQWKAARATQAHDEQRRKQSQKPKRANHYGEVVPRSAGVVKRGRRLRADPTQIGTAKGAGRWPTARGPGIQPLRWSSVGPKRHVR